MTVWRTMLAAMVLLAVSGPVHAQKVIPGSQAATQNACLTRDITWHTSLDQALAEARRTHKLVFWMHMLGSMDRYT